MISIIVPIYKAERTIARCVESVIAQEYPDWELILVDDGSPDKSGVICDEYAEKDKRIRVVHQKNAGASAARNHGMKAARGEHICFIDSDDYVTSQYLSVFSQDPQCDFEIQGFTHTYPHSENVIERISNEGKYTIREMFGLASLWYLIKGPCCKLFRRSVLEGFNVRFPKDFSYGEDELFVLDYLRHCSKEVFVHAVSHYFYTHENEDSLTHKFVSGDKLQVAISMQYRLMRDIDTQMGPLPESFICFYRKDRAIEFYQSRYNCLADPHNSLVARCVQFLSYDSELWQFVKGVIDLPEGFAMIRRVLRFINFMKLSK